VLAVQVPKGRGLENLVKEIELKLRSIAVGAVLLAAGIGIGWAGNHYWSLEMRKAQSFLAIGLAQEAAKKDDLDTAIQYATQAWILYEDSPIADVTLTSLRDKRAAKLAGCPGAQTEKTPITR
jgi:hypothetical protein